MRRESWDQNRYESRRPLRGEERYTWDTRHWEQPDRARDRNLWEEEEEQPGWVRTVERAFVRLVVLGLAALMLVQLWQHGSFAQWLQFSQFEGKTVSPEQLASASRENGLPATAAASLRLTVTLVSNAAAPQARLLVDGKPAGNFTTASVTLTAPAGAVLSIDPGTDARALSFRVTALSDRTRAPRLGTEVTTRGKAVILGKVE